MTPKALEAVRAKIELQADIIVEQMIQRKQFDAASELAPYLPLSIVRDLVGLGEHGRNNMLAWGAATFELMGDPCQRSPQAGGQSGQRNWALKAEWTLRVQQN